MSGFNSCWDKARKMSGTANAGWWISGSLRSLKKMIVVLGLYALFFILLLISFHHNCKIQNQVRLIKIELTTKCTLKQKGKKT